MMINLKRWVATPTSNRSSRGQSLVELALMLPILLLIFVGILDLGQLFDANVTIANAAREGARYAASNPTNTSGIQIRVINEAAGSLNPPLTASNISISEPNGSGGGNLVTVTVSYNFTLVTAYLFAGARTIPLQARVTMMIN